MRRTAGAAAAIVAVACVGCSTFEPQSSGAVERSIENDQPSTLPRPSILAPPPAPAPSLTAMAVTTAPTELGYVFPVSPARSASYGRVHHDYPATDIFASCGTEVLAVIGGVVQEISLTDVWSAATDDPAVRGGLSVSLVGDDDVRYYTSHLRDVLPTIAPGARVVAGQVIAHVGDTGNAVGTGCHVHFGISPPCGPGDWAVRRGILYPWPYLDDWRVGSQTSPAAGVQKWLDEHSELCDLPPS